MTNGSLFLKSFLKYFETFLKQCDYAPKKKDFAEIQPLMKLF
jgi:hypothetical protein